MDPWKDSARASTAASRRPERARLQHQCQNYCRDRRRIKPRLFVGYCFESRDWRWPTRSSDLRTWHLGRRDRSASIARCPSVPGVKLRYHLRNAGFKAGRFVGTLTKDDHAAIRAPPRMRLRLRHGAVGHPSCRLRHRPQPPIRLMPSSGTRATHVHDDTDSALAAKFRKAYPR
jgi:hypothetical protein